MDADNVKGMTKLMYIRQQFDDGIIDKAQLQNYIERIMMSPSLGSYM